MKFKKKILKNGLRIVMVPMPQNTAVTILIVVETGSKYEDKKTNGMSHFLEHMCFKGTEKRPSAMQISHELESMGANYNAFTSNELTGYYVKSHPKYFDKTLDVVSDIYLNQLFDENEIKKEKGVILEEMNMYNDLPQRKVVEDLLKLLYADQPAGRTIIGTSENIKRFTRKDFVEYKEKHYVSSSTVVFISGNFDEKEVVKKVSKSFSNISISKKFGKSKTKDAQKNPTVSSRFKKTDQTHIAIGIRGFSAGHKDSHALKVLTTILGIGMSSRLFQKVREELGAAYYISSSVFNFTDHGCLVIRSGLDTKRYKEVTKAILGECNNLRNETVSKSELEKAKQYIIGSMYLDLETSDSLAEFYAEQEILKDELRTPKEIAEKIKEVTASDVRRVAKKIFIDKNLNLAIIGPKSEKNKLRQILTFSDF